MSILANQSVTEVIVNWYENETNHDVIRPYVTQLIPARDRDQLSVLPASTENIYVIYSDIWSSNQDNQSVIYKTLTHTFELTDVNSSKHMSPNHLVICSFVTRNRRGDHVHLKFLESKNKYQSESAMEHKLAIYTEGVSNLTFNFNQPKLMNKCMDYCASQGYQENTREERIKIRDGCIYASAIIDQPNRCPIVDWDVCEEPYIADFEEFKIELDELINNRSQCCRLCDQVDMRKIKDPCDIDEFCDKDYMYTCLDCYEFDRSYKFLDYKLRCFLVCKSCYDSNLHSQHINNYPSHQMVRDDSKEINNKGLAFYNEFLGSELTSILLANQNLI